MSTSSRQLFLLPDLGEGLPDAEIVEWKVAEGEEVLLDAPLVAMETAKAVVDVPSPFSGRLLKRFGQAGDVIETGKPLAEFELGAGPQRAAGHDTGHGHGGGTGTAAHVATPPAVPAAPAAALAPAAPAPAGVASRADSGTVVGAMSSSDRVVHEALVEIGGVRAMPAVRALARKLGVSLAQVRQPSGPGGSVSADDVRKAAAQPAAAPVPAATAPAPPPPAVSAAPVASAPAHAPAAGYEPLRGVRRNMARTMSAAHAAVVPTTLMDDADIHAWGSGQDVTVRLIRALVAASRAEPALNAWYDGAANARLLHRKVDIGIAVDTEEGLFVPALRNADVMDAPALRTALNRLREQVKTRSIPAEDLSGYTLMLSNFGIYAGRYATPVVVPPCVCIVAAGKLHYAAVPVMGSIAAHRVIPLSLTFDHRACTGGEAARFLKAMLEDLARAS